MIDLPPAKLQSSAVANAVLKELQALALDAFNPGGYYDISPRVHDIVLRQARLALEAHGEACARAALEAAADEAENFGMSMEARDIGGQWAARDIGVAIRALKDKP